MPRGKNKSRRGRPSALSMLTFSELMHEVDRRRGMLNSLMSQRQQMQSEMQRVDREIGDLQALGAGAGAGGMSMNMGMSMVKRGRGRPRGSGRGPGRPPSSATGGPMKVDGRSRGRGGNETSLPQSLHTLLQGKTLGVAEIADAVQAAGYKTKSKNFRTIVNAALLATPNRFRKVRRGEYTAR